MTYEVSVIREQSELKQALAEWREFLSELPAGRDFFNDPDVIDFAVEQMGKSPFIVMVRQAGALQCIAPFHMEPSRFRLQFSVFTIASLPVQQMSLFGSGFVYRRSADVAKCCALVFDAVQQADFDLSLLNALELNGPLWQYCSADNHKPVGLSFVRPSQLIDTAFRRELPSTFDDYLATLGSSTRASLKRRSKKLLSGHGAKLTRVTSSDQVAPFLDAADEIFGDSWQAKTYGQSQRNGLGEVARLQSIARHGWFRSYLLTGDMGPLAFQFGYLYGDTFYACDFAFAQKWSEHGPGAVLMHLMLEDLYRDKPPRFLDLGTGDSPQKHSFRGAPRDVGDYYVIPRKRWRRLMNAQRGLSKIEAVGRATLVKLGLDKAVRRFLKHKR
jgi:hypothetical protein